MAQYFSGQFAEAITSYSLALQCDPLNASSCLNLSYIYSCCPDGTFHEVSRALELAQQACDRPEGNDWHAYQAVAAAYARAGDFASALRFVEKARDIVPDDLEWRVDRIERMIRKNQPYTASLVDDIQKLHDDWKTPVDS